MGPSHRAKVGPKGYSVLAWFVVSCSATADGPHGVMIARGRRGGVIESGHTCVNGRKAKWTAPLHHGIALFAHAMWVLVSG